MHGPELGKLVKIARNFMMRLSGSPPDVFSGLLNCRSNGLIIAEVACAFILCPILIVGEHNPGFGVHFARIVGYLSYSHPVSIRPT